MNRADLQALDNATLADLVLRQAERIATLAARLAEMGRRLEEMERRAARGAAPFARPEGKRSPAPKRPGRKGGHEGACRVRPPEEAVDSRIEAPLTRCPHWPRPNVDTGGEFDRALIGGAGRPFPGAKKCREEEPNVVAGEG